MREDLDGSGLRESSLLPDWDDTDGNGIRPSFDAGGGAIYLYDNHRIFAADAFNGYYLCFTDKIAGKKTWKTGPYQKTTTAAVGIDTETGGASDMWDDDDANGYAMIDNDESWTADIDFRVYNGDETGTKNANYVLGSMTGARIRVTYLFNSTVVDDNCDIQIYTDTNADGTLDAYKSIGQLKESDSALGSIKEREVVFTIPEELFDSTVGDAIVSSGGIGRVRFNVAWGSGTTQLTIYKIDFEVDVETTGMSDLATISDGETYRLTTNVDFADPSKKVWTGCQYSIAKEIYKHIDTAESPGDLIASYDTIVTLTAAATVEHTAGVSFRKFVDKTPLQILQALAIEDKSLFWMTNGATTVNWKYTFNDNPVDETLTDSEMMSIEMVQDYDKMFNEIIVYGMRIQDEQLRGTASDATSIDVFNATRDMIDSGHGITSQYDAETRATALLNRHKDIQKMVAQVSLRGNCLTAAHSNTIILGDEVTINSTYLGLNATYIVQGIRYDTKTHMSTLSLHPRLSQTGIQEDFLRQSGEGAIRQQRKGDPDVYIPANTTEVL